MTLTPGTRRENFATPDDKLSYRINRPGRTDVSSLRRIRVGRLLPALKMIVRRPLRSGAGFSLYSAYCEICDEWVAHDRTGTGILPHEIACPNCDSRFLLEFAVYTRVPVPKPKPSPP